jgi:hypothetical protein
VEDVVLVTKDGYSLINPELPYQPKDLEAFMGKTRRDLRG